MPRLAQHRRAAAGVRLASLVSLVLLAYGRILSLFFTATDTLPLIDTSRVAGCADVGRILSTPLLAGTTFADATRFFRPLSSFSFSLDYAVWHLNPVGYQLTNLLLHLACTLLVWALVRQQNGGAEAAAWLAAALFTLHPILVDTVPAAAHRQDMLMTLWLLLALLAFGRQRRVLSLAAAFLALMAKETAVLILPLIFFAALIGVPAAAREARRGSRPALAAAARQTLPYLLVTALFGLWHTAVLHGLGGSARLQPGFTAWLASLVYAVTSYVLDLLFPIGELVRDISPAPPLWQQIGSGVAAAGLAVVMGFRRRLWPGAAAQPAAGPRVAIRLLRLLCSGLLLLLAAYPLLFARAGVLLQRAYSGAGAPWLARLMPGRAGTPFDYYLAQFNQLLLSLLLVALLGAAGLLLIAARRRQIRAWIRTSPAARPVLFWSLWLALPLLLFVATRAYAPRSLYLAAVPFAALLAHGLLAGRPARRPEARLALAGLLTLAAGLILLSPLLHADAGWRDSGRTAQLFLRALDVAAAAAPPGTEIHVDGMPVSRSVARPQARELSYLTGYSVQSWLNLTRPDRALTVVLHGAQDVSGAPDSVRLVADQAGSEPGVLRFRAVSQGEGAAK